MKNKNKLLTVGLILLSFLLLAASNPGLGLRVESTDLRAFPIVSLRLSAWNTEGLPLRDIKLEDFLIRENGGPVFAPVVGATTHGAFVQPTEAASVLRTRTTVSVSAASPRRKHSVFCFLNSKFRGSAVSLSRASKMVRISLATSVRRPTLGI